MPGGRSTSEDSTPIPGGRSTSEVVTLSRGSLDHRGDYPMPGGRSTSEVITLSRGSLDQRGHEQGHAPRFIGSAWRELHYLHPAGPQAKEALPGHRWWNLTCPVCHSNRSPQVKE